MTSNDEHVDAESLAERDAVLRQLRTWREHLIDLTRGNPLLGINRSRTSKLQVASPTLDEIVTALLIDDRKLRMPDVRRRPAPLQEDEPADDGMLLADQDQDEESKESPWIVREGDISFEGDPGTIAKRLRRIRANARATVEERGVTTLQITCGAVRWHDPLLGESTAPLVLIPCGLENTGTDTPPLLVAADEEPLLNPALALYLRERHQRTLPSLPDEWSTSTSTLSDYLLRVHDQLGADWSVTEEAWLSTFSFENLTMYEDLDRLTDEAVGNPIIRAFSGVRVEMAPDVGERLGDDLDLYPTPGGHTYPYHVR